MKIIAFDKTTLALLAGRKTVTRRDWTAKHAITFHAGEFVQAWNHTPRVKGANRIGTIRLTAAPSWEYSQSIPTSDYEAEGFAYLDEQEMTLGDGVYPRELWDDWFTDPVMLWVVRFELVEVL